MDTASVIEKIRVFADVSSTALQQRHRGRPDAELADWLTLAAEREAMAKRVYDPKVLQRRIQNLATDKHNGAELVAIIRKAIECIWTHEKVHNEYLDALQTLTKTDSIWKSFVAEVKGNLTSHFTEPSSLKQHVAEMLLHIVIPLGAPVPDFMPMMGALKFRDFCTLNSALEETAVLAYQRMIELNRECEEKGTVLTVGFNRQIKLFLLDEQTHRDVFRTIATEWLVDDAIIRPGLTANAALSELKDILESVNRPPNGPRVKDDGELVYGAAPFSSRLLFTDAGLAPLFADYGIRIDTYPLDLARELIEPRVIRHEDGHA